MGFAVAKAVSTHLQTPRDATVFDLSFGFGDYVRNLSERGKYQWLLEGQPFYAARMPLTPLLFTALGRISTKLETAAHIKNMTMSAISIASLKYLFDEFPQGRRGQAAWTNVCGLLAVSPPVVKHASATHYEEGLLTEMLQVWSAAVLWLARGAAGGPLPKGRVRLAALALGTGSASMMLKTSMAPAFMLTELVAGAYAVRVRSAGTAAAMVAAAAPLIAWGLRNRRVTGKFSIGTSWDGQNLYRGWSSEAAELYPDVCLDRMFDSALAQKADGSLVEISPKPEWTNFPDEWAMDRLYRERARTWMRSHPREALRFSLRKAYNFFMAVKPSPLTYGTDARAPSDRGGSTGRKVTTASLLATRATQVIMIGMACRLWATARFESRALVASVAAVNGAYAFPYLVGFNYDRHVTAYHVVVGTCVAVMAGELDDRR